MEINAHSKSAKTNFKKAKDATFQGRWKPNANASATKSVFHHPGGKPTGGVIITASNNLPHPGVPEGNPTPSSGACKRSDSLPR